MRISVVITTYNRPDALSLVLRGLAAQTAGDFEVLVADDGSTPETAEMLAGLKPELNFPLRHVWQPDDGFRAPMARNRASAVATGDYIVFLDGDCLPLTDFIAQHRKLAAPGWLVSGNRVLLDRRLSERATEEQLPLWRWGAGDWLRRAAHRAGQPDHPAASPRRLVRSARRSDGGQDLQPRGLARGSSGGQRLRRGVHRLGL